MSYPKLTPVIAKGATEPRYLEDRFADVINVKDFGAKGNGIADDTVSIQAALNAGLETGKTVVFPSGTYLFTKASVTANETHRRISIQAIGNVVLYSTKEKFEYGTNQDEPLLSGWWMDYALGFFGKRRGNETRLSAGIEKSSQKAEVSDLNLEKDDLALVLSTQLVSGEHRTNWTIGQVCKILECIDDAVYFYDCLEDDYPAYSTENLTLSVVDEKLYFNSLTYLSYRTPQYKIVCNTGANAGKHAYIALYRPDTKEISFGEYTGFEMFNYPCANGDTFTLVKETTIESVIPIHVTIHGDFTIKRDPVRNTEQTKPAGSSSNADEGFRAITIAYGDGCIVDGITMENFDANGLLLWHCYKSSVYNCKAICCSDDGTGYGFLFGGSYGCRVSHCEITASRAGVSTDGGEHVCQSINNIVDHCACYGSGVRSNRFDEDTEVYPDDNAHVWYPVGQESNQAFSTHGDAVNHIIDSCVSYGTYSFSRLRGKNETVINCRSVGSLGLMFNLKACDGARLFNNYWIASPAAIGSTNSFAVLQCGERYRYKGSIFLQDNTAVNIGGQFLTLNGYNGIDIVKKLIVTDNTVSFCTSPQADDVIQAGVSRIKTSNTMPYLSECVFSNNKIVGDVRGTYNAFIGVGNTFRVQVGSWVQNGEENFYAEVAASGNSGDTVAIPVNVPRSTPIAVTIQRPGAFVSCCCYNVRLADLKNETNSLGDTNPLNYSNKNNVNVIASSEDSSVSNMLNIKLQDGVLYLINKTSSSLGLYVSLTYPH